MIRILVLSSEIATAEGIHVGSTTAEVLAAYPNYDQKVEGSSSVVYSVRDTNGQLMFEIANDAAFPGYWPAGTDGTVVWIRAVGVPTEDAYASAGAGDDAICQS